MFVKAPLPQQCAILTHPRIYSQSQKHLKVNQFTEDAQTRSGVNEETGGLTVTQRA